MAEESAFDQTVGAPAPEPGSPLLAAATEELERRLGWLTIGRFLFVTGTFLLVILVQLSSRDLSSPSTAPLLRFAVFGLLAGTIHLGLRWVGIPPLVRAYFQIGGDLALVTLLVLETGGVTSPFSMLYLIIIGTAAVMLQRRAGLTVAEIAWLLYASVVIALYLGWLPQTDAPTEIGEDSAPSIGRLAYSLGVHLVGFYGVALLTAMLSNRLARMERQLAATTGSLADLEVFHRDVIESMSSGLMLLDLDSRVVGINRTGRIILDIEEGFEGRRVSDLGLVDEESWESLRAQAGDERVRDETVLTAEGGEQRYVGFSVGVIRDSGGTVRGYSIVFQELTEWRRLQQELGVKERMAAVGELAAGLAHELGNPLAAISGSVQMLRSSGSVAEPEGKLLDIVLEESRRLDRTIKSFLRFARPQERQAHRFDVCELVSENLDLLRNSEEVGPHHRFDLDLEPTGVMLVADRDQIAQVFWNLSRNALRAMPDGGTLRVVGRADEESFTLRFEDTGCGMTEAQVHGLFHPFRSYRGSTGIGMAIVYRIVEQHEGTLNVDSEVGRGTRVEIQLPLMGVYRHSVGDVALPAAVGGRREGT